MSDRYTEAFALGVAGSVFVSRGRHTREEMLKLYRDHHTQLLINAQNALDVPDEEIVVKTYIGLFAYRNSEEVK